MTTRKIVKIDENKCNGCGECILNCPEGALQIIDGKARLVKESYCDGLGACIGPCPQGAITLEEREADAFDEAAVKQQLADAARSQSVVPATGGCPGAALKQLSPAPASCPASQLPHEKIPPGSQRASSQLSHWPVQLTLMPPDAPFLDGADLLLVADCVPFAMADFHSRLLRGRPVVVACPKLDNAQTHAEKLQAVFEQSDLKSLTIIRMEVPCCRGLCHIAQTARQASGRDIPIEEIVVSIEGQVQPGSDGPRPKLDPDPMLE